jgi:DNA-binding MarR family transcriptional regulator
MSSSPQQPSSAVDALDGAFIDSPTFKLLVAASLLARPFIEHIGPERDLTLPEWRTLVALDAKGTLSNVEVSELTGLDKMSVSRALDRLRSNGRVQRTRDEVDGRRQINRMTSAGRATYRSVVKLARDRQDAMASDLSARDLVVLERTLDRIINHLKEVG